MKARCAGKHRWQQSLSGLRPKYSGPHDSSGKQMCLQLWWLVAAACVNGSGATALLPNRQVRSRTTKWLAEWEWAERVQPKQMQ